MRTPFRRAERRRCAGVLAIMLACQGVFFVGANLAHAGTDGTIQGTVKIAHGTANGPTLADTDLYGTRVVGLGDLDGDGVRDIAVGAHRDDTGGTDRGAAYIHFMNVDGSVKSTAKIASGTANGPALVNSDFYANGIASIGDLDDDGVTDLLVGAEGDDTGGSNYGAAYIHFMNANGSVKSTVKIASGTTNGPVFSGSGVGYGFSATGLGDLNGDGVEDIAVGAYLDDTGGSTRGAAYISFLNTDGSIDSTVKIAHGTANGPVLADVDSYGRGISSLGDLNGDGVTDLAVGSVGDDTGGSARGAVYIHFLNTDGSIDSTVKIAHGTTNGPVLADSDVYGNALTGLGDIDGDGVMDVAVGATGDDTGGNGRGAVYVHLMKIDGSIKSTKKIVSGTGNGPTLVDGDNYGRVASIGDLNKDGIVDLAVGANADDTGGNARGAVHIHFLARTDLSGNACPSARITLVSPRGGETYFVGDTPVALWSVQGCQIERVTLRLSRDGGKTFSETVLASSLLPRSGHMLWTVPDPPTVTARLEAELIGMGGISLGRDRSQEDFIILPVTDALAADATTLIVDGVPSGITPFDPTRLAAEGSSLTIDEEIDAVPAERSDLDPSAARGCIVGTDVKKESSRTVYRCAPDGTIRPYPDQATFLTWNDDFSRVITMSDAMIAAIPQGAFVTARPGATLIKTPEDAAVYAITPNRTLRQIASEEVATVLYGPDWQREVIDVDPSFLAAYRMGAMIE